MGLSNGNLALLLAARHASSSEFKEVVTLGKMAFWPTKTFLTQILRYTDTSASGEKVLSSLNGDGSLFISKYLHATYGNLEKSRIYTYTSLQKKRLAAPKGLINFTSQ